MKTLPPATSTMLRCSSSGECCLWTMPEMPRRTSSSASWFGRPAVTSRTRPENARSRRLRTRATAFSLAEVVVEDEDVDAGLREALERLLDRLGDADDAQRRVLLEQPQQPLAKERVVVDDEHRDGRRHGHAADPSAGSHGRMTSKRQPASVWTCRRSPPNVRTSVREM